MREKVEVLLKKYYGGKTSLSEERELRELLLEVRGFEGEKEFFMGLQAVKTLEPSHKPVPKSRGEINPWQKVAAVMVVFLGLTWLFVDHESKNEETLAYAQVMEAFSLIQENMQKGTASLEVIQEMKHLGKTNELFNIKEKEEK